MATQQPKNTPSFAGQFLKNYLEEQHLTQEKLGNDLNIEPRTIRAYVSGERQLNNIHELRRIADRLGIEPERLGIAASLYIPRTPEQIKETLDHVWSLVEQSRVQEALTVAERLTENLKNQITAEDPELLRGLAQAHHATGYIFSEVTRANQSYGAIVHYQQMASIARTINDHTLLNIALTYEGDMYRRLGDLEKAIKYLEAARDTTPRADAAARGNGLQLLGRAYLRILVRGKQEHKKDFESAMAQAEELAHAFKPEESSTRGHYSPGTVYEEYGRSYIDLGEIQKAIEYLDQAEATLPATKFWQLLVMISRAIALIKDGELQLGTQLAIDAAKQSQEAGIGRYLERIYNVQELLDEEEDNYARKQREIRQIGSSLREALGKGNREI